MATYVLPNLFSTTARTKDLFTSRWQIPLTSSAVLAPLGEPAISYATKSTAYVVSRNGEPFPSWVKPAIAAFNEIGNLSENWDTYGGKAASPELMRQSFSILQLIMQSNSPAPSVVPLRDGGVQLEWHRNGQDLEIAFPMYETAQYYYRNRATGAEEEGLADEIGSLARLVGGLA